MFEPFYQLENLNNTAYTPCSVDSSSTESQNNQNGLRNLKLH